MMAQVKNLNKSINEYEPWSKSAADRAAFLKDAVAVLHRVGQRLMPFLPNTAEHIQKATEGSIQKMQPLFPRLTV